MAKPSFTPQVIDQFQEFYLGSLEKSKQWIQQGELRRGGTIYGLMHEHMGLGLVAVAQGRMPLARGRFRAAAIAACHLRELYERETRAIDNDYVSPHHVDPLTVAIVSRDEAVLSNMCRLFWPKHADRCVYHASAPLVGGLIKHLCRGEISEARHLLDGPQPEIAKWWIGSVACLKAIVNEDESAFRNGINVGHQYWLREARGKNKGRPRGYYFLDGASMMLLAERTWHRKLDGEFEHIPTDLLRCETIEIVDVGV